MERLKSTHLEQAVIISAVPGMSTPVVANDTAAEGRGQIGRVSRRTHQGCNAGLPVPICHVRGRGSCASLFPSWTRHPRQATSERPARRYINQVFHDLTGQVATMRISHEIAPHHRGSGRCGEGDHCSEWAAVRRVHHLLVPLKPWSAATVAGQALLPNPLKQPSLSPGAPDLHKSAVS